MNAKQIARKLGVSTRTVYNWVERGMPCHRQPQGIKMVLMFNMEEVNAWLADERKVSGQ